MNRQFALANSQRGAVMLVTLILITVMATITVAVLEGSSMNTLIARNEQAQMETRERAQSLLDNAMINSANLPFTGGIGSTNCRNRTGCTTSSVVVAQELIAGADDQRSSIMITRQAPLLAPPPRAMSSSAGLFRVATFEAQAEYNAADANLGTAIIGQGVLALVNKGSQ